MGTAAVLSAAIIVFREMLEAALIVSKSEEHTSELQSH